MNDAIWKFKLAARATEEAKEILKRQTDALKTLWQSASILFWYLTDEKIEIKKEGKSLKIYEEEQLKEIAYCLWLFYLKIADSETKINFELLKQEVKKRGWEFTPKKKQ